MTEAGLSLSVAVNIRSGNWDEELPVNPNSELQPFKVKIASIPFAGGSVQYISEGDQPVLSPDNHSLAFIKSGQVWMAQLDSVNDAKNLFYNQGDSRFLQAGARMDLLLFFVSDRRTIPSSACIV